MPGLLQFADNDVYLKMSNVAASGFIDLIAANGLDEIQIGTGTPIRTPGTIIAAGGILGNVTGDLNGDVTGNLFGNAASASIASTVNEPAQPAITSLGTLIGLNVVGNGILTNLLTVTGAIAAQGGITGNLVGNATTATSAGNATTANSALVVTNNAQPNITSVGQLAGLNVFGSVLSTNFTTAGGVAYSVGGPGSEGNGMWSDGNNVIRWATGAVNRMSLENNRFLMGSDIIQMSSLAGGVGGLGVVVADINGVLSRGPSI